MKTIRRADPDDTAIVHSLVHTAARRLDELSYDQRPRIPSRPTYERIGEQIRSGETWVVCDGRDPIATMAVSRVGDTDSWTASELAQPAIYCSNTAVIRHGDGLDGLVVRWVVDQAATQGAGLVRLDVWHANQQLHDYCRQQGWEHVRTADLSGRGGTLFQKAAAPDSEARSAFNWQPQPAWRDLPSAVRHPTLLAGTPVIVGTADGPVSATVSEVIRDGSMEEVAQGWENGVGDSPTRYAVRRDGRIWIPSIDQVWADRITIFQQYQAKAQG